VKSGAGRPSRTAKRTSKRRAVGIVRVSRVGDRAGEQFVSPSEQRERIRTACERDGLTLVDTLEELDVSGGAPLAKRPGLRKAIDLVEAGEADTVIVAFFDRLVRSLRVQLEVAERVEAAGGTIIALDVGEVGVGATGKLTAQFLGAVAEYHRNVTAERTQEAKRRAIARSVPTFPRIPPGYQQRPDGTLEPHPTEATVVAEAFRRRADGATVMEVRDYLRTNGISRSYHGTQSLLGSRIVLGELNFGKLTNPSAHLPIVDHDTWARVQRARSPRGRRPKSERLLARLGILRCGSCGSKMVVGFRTVPARGEKYPMYRCPPINDCTRRVTISANLAETAVTQAVRELLDGMAGTASIGGATEHAERELDTAEKELAAAVQAFSGLDDVDAARAKLLELREQRDRKRDRLADLQAATLPAITVTAQDWNTLTTEEQRALIVAVIDHVQVAPASQGTDRLTVTPR
jgi:DNA invertase Pin-like site-specific DNA recombinase